MPIADLGDGKAQLRVARPRRFLGSAAAHRLEIDGEPIGKLRNGETKTFEIDAGEVELTFGLLGRSVSITRSIKPGHAYAAIAEQGRNSVLLPDLVLHYVDVESGDLDPDRSDSEADEGSGGGSDLRRQEEPASYVPEA